MVSFVLAFILFLVTLPINVAKVSLQTVALVNNTSKKVNIAVQGKRDTALDSIKRKRENSNKTIKNLGKFATHLAKTTLNAMKALVLFIRSICLILVGLGSLTTILTILVGVGLISAMITTAVLVSEDETGGILSSFGGSQQLTEEEINKAKYHPLGTYSFNPSASVQQIISMSESEIWALISDGRFNSFESACAAAYACEQQKAIDDANNVPHVGISDIGCEKVWWTNQLVVIEVPRWEWEDSAKQVKNEGTVKFNVNKNLAEYWTSFLTDLFNCSDQYVIVMKGDFNFRQKSSTTREGDYSAHSFGTAIDINWESEGMGAVTLSGGKNAVPFLSYADLDITKRSEACAFHSSWCELVKQYQLDWGGFWSAGSLDPTHFSLVGDRKKDNRSYEPKVEGKVGADY